MQRRWAASTHYRSAIEALRGIRKELGISQSELARRLGRHRSFINKIELLNQRLDILEFIAVAEALGIDPGKLLKTIRAKLPADIQI